MSVLMFYVENFVITFDQMKYAILGWARDKSRRTEILCCRVLNGRGQSTVQLNLLHQPKRGQLLQLHMPTHN